MAGKKRAESQKQLFDDRRHFYHAPIDHLQSFGCGEREVEDAAFSKWPSVIDDDDDAPLGTRIGNPQSRAEWKAAVRSGKSLRIIPLATGRLARVVCTVEGRYPGKAPWTFC